MPSVEEILLKHVDTDDFVLCMLGNARGRSELSTVALMELQFHVDKAFTFEVARFVANDRKDFEALLAEVREKAANSPVASQRIASERIAHAMLCSRKLRMIRFGTVCGSVRTILLGCA